MIAFDSEVTGRDWYHGSTFPYFLTICYEDNNIKWWEWDVDPITRIPYIPQEDKIEIKNELINQDVAGHNVSFDVKALHFSDIIPNDEWNWSLTYDTLLAGHLIRSDQPHNLTAMAMDYLSIDIKPLEESVEKATKKARDYVRRHYPSWRRAQEGLPDMPSVKGDKDGEKGTSNDKPWAADMWLPRRLAQELKYPNDHPWYRVLAEYSNADSAVTLPLWKVCKEIMIKNDLWEIYEERRKLLKVIFKMENVGVTLSKQRTDELIKEYTETIEQCKETCLSIARKYNYDLQLPKGAAPNGSLKTFVYDFLKVEPQYNKKSKTGLPSLDVNAKQYYLSTLDRDSDGWQFFNAIQIRSKRETAVGYMTSYLRFGKTIGDIDYAVLGEIPNNREEESRPDNPVDGKNKQRRSDTSSIGDKVLGMGGGSIQGGIRSTTCNSVEGVSGTSNQLYSSQRRDTKRDDYNAFMRQPTLCKSGASKSSNEQGELRGYGIEKQTSIRREECFNKSTGETGEGGTPSYDNTNRRTSTGNKSNVQEGMSKGKGEYCFREKIRSHSFSNIVNSKRQILETCSIKDDWIVIHPSLNMCGTLHLRMSSSNPNGQNISRQETECEECSGEGCDICNQTGIAFRSIRYIFGPAPGREWWSLDYKNVELRIPAYESEEDMMIDLFERENEPPYYGSNHLLIAHILHPKKFESCVNTDGILDGRLFKKTFPREYQCTKNGDFGLQYGAGEAKGDATYRVNGATKLIKRKFAKQDQLSQQCIKMATKLGYVETIPDKTVNPRRGYPMFCRRSETGGIQPTTPLNYHVSGTAMWGMCKAMVRVEDQLEIWRSKSSWDGIIVLNVHDELVYDFPKLADPRTNPKGSNLWRIKKIKSLMEESGKDLVLEMPLKVSVEWHPNNWSEGISIHI